MSQIAIASVLRRFRDVANWPSVHRCFFHRQRLEPANRAFWQQCCRASPDVRHIRSTEWAVVHLVGWKGFQFTRYFTVHRQLSKGVRRQAIGVSKQRWLRLHVAARWSMLMPNGQFTSLVSLRKQHFETLHPLLICSTFSASIVIVRSGANHMLGIEWREFPQKNS